MLKLADNPPLGASSSAILEAPGSWWAAHTRPRREKALAHRLAELHVPYFLPMIGRVHFSGGRKRHVLFPLFAGYLFIAGGPEAEAEARHTGHLAQTLPPGDEGCLREELAALRRAVEDPFALDWHPGLAEGRRCRITRGPLRGLEGLVLSIRPRARILLQVSLLGQGASVEVEASAVEVLSS